MSNSLYRKEVLDVRKDGWLGSVQAVQPIPIRIITIVTTIMVVIAIIYFFVGGYTRRVHATGTMMPPEGLITVGAINNGVVTKRTAIEGSHVKKGDVLFVISLESHSASGPTQLRAIQDLKRQRDFLNDQLAIRYKTAPIERQSLINQIANLSKQHQQIAAQLEQDNRVLPLVQQVLERTEKAKSQYLTTDAQYQNELYTYAQLLNSHAQFLQSQTNIEGKIAELTAKLQQFNDTLAHDTNDIKRQISEAEQRITEKEGQQNNVIVAPEDGTLTAIRGYVGQQVSVGTPLLTLLPTGHKLDAELYVSSASIGFIKEGNPVLLRYAAYPYQKFGLYHGTVTEITRAPVSSSADGQQQQQGAGGAIPADEKNKAPTDNSVYRIRVKPEFPYVNVYGQKKMLEAGMAVEADIAIDYRRLYQWMFDPLFSIKNSMQNVLGRPKQ
ncbi:HlyD family secretion protein [Entomobacter blattae]|uniref:Colicin V secretion protein CvaA n=1 Tax=Entomobacter blattae TaxID=2762277 RepID=A0A7H1NT88_9PROT|nr:HlyD family efflux transporter periplasmic adaptor subunit [Entomobacter blattae]QNT78998.1 Colicin V secretion protein CvaA [Entomobacter blattae]